ncbi:hypothetical protein FACS1894137_14400 [Spirochaetia bacterium]|nr:hypothetical protein FACS1894137_14400 [Spirochaetia bacterium]
MGRRTYFYENITGKSCKDLLLENYSAFSQWFLKEYGASSDKQKLTGFLHTDTSGALSFDKPYRAIIDEMLPFFITCFSETKNSEHYFFKDIPISVSSRYYEDDSGVILGTGDTVFIDLWDILLRGRSLLTGDWIMSIDGCAGYMTAGEQQLLKEKIRIYFGTGDANVDYTGIRCMCDVLNGIGDKHELLFILEGI